MFCQRTLLSNVVDKFMELICTAFCFTAASPCLHFFCSPEKNIWPFVSIDSRSIKDEGRWEMERPSVSIKSNILQFVPSDQTEAVGPLPYVFVLSSVHGLWSEC